MDLMSHHLPIIYAPGYLYSRGLAGGINSYVVKTAKGAVPKDGTIVTRFWQSQQSSPHPYQRNISLLSLFQWGNRKLVDYINDLTRRIIVVQISG